MNEINKKEVTRRFSKASKTYDNHSFIHKIIAEKLFLISDKPKSTDLILEIGSGTGILTKILCKTIQTSRIVPIDISYTMCQVLKDKIPGIHPIVCDFEFTPFNFLFPYIYSSSALQWASNEDKIANIVSNRLGKNGKFSLAIVLNRTFQELHLAKKELFNSTTIHKLPEHEKLIQAFLENKLKLDFNCREQYKDYFATTDEAFRSIKGLGIGGINKNSLNSSELVKLKKEYETICLKQSTKPYLEYDIGYYIGHK